ncbi:Uncharacterised protein [Providencia rustigianii]|uniref:Uncharacterized protein n=3 Tax=Morganellaceae TaxID=1903414 RepID=D1NY12_9GAMM|nr:hypothetical protein PROVRUST_05133 [Providencia rustigianii DSM 4541]SPY77406.1 Uncharacterised protein [Providencia rustigianii]SUC26791.1 Uncharacterised protein [Providencia rustigianii]SUC35399.1 Uncharacterised protein [Providencia rustigianii]VEB69272.1 Uncharacterised protein [Providencia rustigianii]
MSFESEYIMKKILPIAFGLFAALSVSHASAGNVCDKYFKEMNALVKQAEEQYKNEPNAGEQISLMKSQLEEAKKALATYPEESQEQACSQALTAIEQAKEAVNNQ